MFGKVYENPKEVDIEKVSNNPRTKPKIVLLNFENLEPAHIDI